MSSMFQDCESLKYLNLSNFNTKNVTNMSWMFSGCSSLKELNLSNFNINNVTDMSWMFSRCSSIEELNISNSFYIDVKKYYLNASLPHESKLKIKI